MSALDGREFSAAVAAWPSEAPPSVLEDIGSAIAKVGSNVPAAAAHKMLVRNLINPLPLLYQIIIQWNLVSVNIFDGMDFMLPAGCRRIQSLDHGTMVNIFPNKQYAASTPASGKVHPLIRSIE